MALSQHSKSNDKLGEPAVLVSALLVARSDRDNVERKGLLIAALRFADHFNQALKPKRDFVTSPKCMLLLLSMYLARSRGSSASATSTEAHSSA